MSDGGKVTKEKGEGLTEVVGELNPAVLHLKL